MGGLEQWGRANLGTPDSSSRIACMSTQSFAFSRAYSQESIIAAVPKLWVVIQFLVGCESGKVIADKETVLSLKEN